jgi:CDP-2,3-bis-(O-geranylgeranyl)-sn-glycerol synthase
MQDRIGAIIEPYDLEMELYHWTITQGHTVLQILYFFLPAYLANMSPVLVRPCLRSLAVPIDGGKILWGKRLLGGHKTWRGLLAGVFVGMIAYELQRFAHEAGLVSDLVLIDYAAHPVLPGLLMGLGAGVGDSVKSFFKRRIDIEPGDSWLVFDQLDFFIGAYVFVAPISAPPLLPTLATLPIIFLGNVASEAVGYWLGFKETWI